MRYAGPLTLALTCLAACGPKPPPSNRKAPEEGISIALYRDDDTSYGIVDDRRWVDIAGSSILLGNIDPGAALASLEIETTSPAVRIGPCTRERLPDMQDAETELNKFAAYEAAVRRKRALREPRSYRRPVPQERVVEQPTGAERFAPIVQCDVAGKPGRYLVRIVYVSSSLAYRVHHEVELREPTKVSIESRFVMQTPHWRSRAEVVLFDGVPGGLEPPKEITRGEMTLDGGTSVLVVPSRDVPAQLRRVFADHTTNGYGIDASAVWATLEVPDVKLVSGLTRVHVAIEGEDERYIDIPAQRRDRSDDGAESGADKKKPADEPLRLELWMDSTLAGQRQRQIVENDGSRMVELVTLAISNSGDAPREVWLEEEARPAKKRMIDRAWPKKPSASGDTIRNRVTVKPGGIERVGYTIVYEL